MDRGQVGRELRATALWIGLAIGVAGAAPARTFDDAQALYAAGDFAAAAAEAQRLASAEGHALAARALLAEAVAARAFEARRPVVEAAQEAALAAIAADDALVEGHLQRVIALGHIARIDGPLAAQREGWAGLARAHIDEALALEPGNAWALATLGGWHLEIVRRSPLGTGRLLFGATRKAGLAAFRTAVAADPENVVIPYEFGLALLALDQARDQAEAAKALDTALARPARDAYGRAMQARARTLRMLMDSGSPAALDTEIAIFLGERGARAGGSAATGSPR